MKFVSNAKKLQKQVDLITRELHILDVQESRVARKKELRKKKLDKLNEQIENILILANKENNDTEKDDDEEENSSEEQESQANYKDVI